MTQSIPPQDHLTALRQVAAQLSTREAQGDALTYRVPAAWAPVGREPQGEAPRAVNPHRFLREHIEAILSAASAPPSRDAARAAGDWVRDAVIYNVFVRLASAYDHDGDGCLGTPSAPDTTGRTCNAQGVRETGTFLKTIALLGHARRLGATAVHLLPVTAVGGFGNKGSLGSPYAIRNPYALEATLADPLVDLDVDVQFRALVEACHALGMRVICEFVFRTASRDADFIAEHPDWFYWIKREIADRPAGAAPDDPRYFGSPPFSPDALRTIKEKVARHDFNDLPTPPDWYRANFLPAPAHGSVAKDAEGRWVGTLPDGRLAQVPGAFADWPPEDLQPPWTDVTYLRIFNDPPEGPDFNYKAYNTLRMYDVRLARDANANRPLWEAVRGILPHWQRTYGIDGCMVDMGHALPPALMTEIIGEARANHPDFALLAENFTVDEESVRTGYNAVLGYQFQALDDIGRMRRLVTRTCIEGLPIAVFGAGETHNTPRVAMRGRGAAFCLGLWMVSCLMPDTIPFLHNGFELADPVPVNLGLGFTPEEQGALGAGPLALFDLASLRWDDASAPTSAMAAVTGFREANGGLVRAKGEGTLAWLDDGSADLLAFGRQDPASGLAALVVLDWRCAGDREVSVAIGEGTVWVDALSGERFASSGGRLTLPLRSGQGRLLTPAR
ncbi:MAG: alpha-amylase [Proteobacteria bacterium]|nr:alpha-amylase [Pseudomonadota bacterium]